MKDKCCHICGKPYDECEPGPRFSYITPVNGELDMIYFCGNECWFAYLRRKQAEGGVHKMKLTDIPVIRAQFQPLHDRAKEAWQGTDPRNEASYKKWLDAWHEIREQEAALCMKYFGHDLYIDGEYLEPLMVLDWIEHFLEANP